MSNLIYKVYFDVKMTSLHDAIEWLNSNNFNMSNLDFDYNAYFYTFKDMNIDIDQTYNIYTKKLKIVDNKKGITICYLVPPKISVHSI
jgi:hypothetical protein